MQNVDFLEFFRTYLLWSEKHSFLSRISKNLSFSLFLLKKKNKWEKRRFFDKNHGLTSLQNVNFFEFFRTSLFRSKKHSFLSRIWKNVSLLRFCRKKNMRKRSIYWQKPWTNPFANCRFFSTLWEVHFWGPKSIIFYPEYQKMFLSSFFAQKKSYKKKVDF